MEDGITRVFCPVCGAEICGIKYGGVIYWKDRCHKHIDVITVGFGEDAREVERELEEEGGEILEVARDGGYIVIIAYFDCEQ